MHAYRKIYVYAGLIIILYSILFYYGLGCFGLMDNNEGLYAEIPREMIASGDFIIPRLNNVPYMEKPPLLYWLTAASYLVFGFNEFAARFIPATSGLLTGILLMRFLFLMGKPREAVLAAVIWGSSLGVTLFARVIFFDMLLTLMITWSMTSFFLWIYVRKKKYLYQFAISLALGILTKGLLALFLPACAIFIFFALGRFGFIHQMMTGDVIKRTFDPLCVVLFLLIAVPWHVAAYYRDSNFLWFYFVNEHFLRFLGLREPHDFYTGPPYFYPIRLAAYLFPWTLLVVLFLWPGKHRQEEQTLKAFLWTWLAAFVIFFTVSSSKANYYIVTAFPPLYLLMAQGLAARKRIFKGYIVPYLLTFLAFLVSGITGILLIGHSFPGLFGYKFSGWAAAPVFIGSALAVSCTWFCRLRAPFVTAVAGMVILHAAILCAFLSILPSCEQDISTRQVVLDIHNVSGDPSLYLFRRFEGYLSSAVFYNRKPIPIIDSCSDDLLYGQRMGTCGDIFLEDDKEIMGKIGKYNAFVLVVKKDLGRFLDTFGSRLVLWKDYGRIQVYANARSFAGKEERPGMTSNEWSIQKQALCLIP